MTRKISKSAMSGASPFGALDAGDLLSAPRPTDPYADDPDRWGSDPTPGGGGAFGLDRPLPSGGLDRPLPDDGGGVFGLDRPLPPSGIEVDRSARQDLGRAVTVKPVSNVVQLRPQGTVEVQVQVLDAQVYQNGDFAIAVVRFQDTSECWLYAFGGRSGTFTDVPSPGEVLATAKAFYESELGPVGAQPTSQWLRTLLQQPTATGTVGVPVSSCAIPADAPVFFGQEVPTPGVPGTETTPDTPSTGGTDTKTMLTWAAAAAAGFLMLKKGI